MVDLLMLAAAVRRGLKAPLLVGDLPFGSYEVSKEQAFLTAARMLADMPPITVTIGKILYHPEAIMLAATPADALSPIRQAAIAATREFTTYCSASAVLMCRHLV